MIKAEDITSRLAVDRETNRTNLVTSLTIGSTIRFEGTSVSEEMVAGDAEDERRRIMQHVYGDVIHGLSELRGEITAMTAAKFDGWKLVNMIDVMRRQMQ